jgi:hypothetical protein
MAAPGDSIFSTIPRNLVDVGRAGCGGEAYSDCGPAEFRQAIGTSFAAPQVAAAAALLLGVDPTLGPDQVMWLLERSAQDVGVDTCRRCGAGRDSLTGWGRLNVRAALKALAKPAQIPPPDAYEPNDDAGVQAKAFGQPRTISATLDYWDDPVDVYAVKLAAGETVFVHVTSTIPVGKVLLWKPNTAHVASERVQLSNRAARSATAGSQARLTYRAPVAGTYYLEVKVGEPTRGRPSYQLSLAKQRAGGSPPRTAQ